MLGLDKLRPGAIHLDGGFGKRPAREYSARDTRQGTIVLNSRTARTVFVAGLAAAGILGVFFLLMS
jgi:hypothetical protein